MSPSTQISKSWQRSNLKGAGAGTPASRQLGSWECSYCIFPRSAATARPTYTIWSHTSRLLSEHPDVNLDRPDALTRREGAKSSGRGWGGNLRAGTKGVPIGEPKSLRLKIFSLAVFFFSRNCIGLKILRTNSMPRFENTALGRPPILARIAPPAAHRCYRRT